MNIIPLGDRVVLKAKQAETITNSGIYIPDSASKDRPYMYEVLAIGPGNKDTDMSSINLGDTVLCGQYSGDEVKIDDSEYKIVAIEYILGKITS